MKKMIEAYKKIFGFAFIAVCSVAFFSCDTWLSGKNFFGTIKEEVKYANAEEIPVYVRYAARTMGDTSPNGSATEKVDIPFEITAVDDTAYQFYMWAAFSTENYPPSKQYNNLLMLNSVDEFNTEYADKLLPETEVWFEDATSSSTRAKVINERDDVFIMPICVKRPTITQSIPKNDKEDVVRNTAITIVFSRSMDASKLIDADDSFNQEYISINKQGGSGEYATYEDLSDYFDKASISVSGKTLTIKQKNGKTLDPSTPVVVEISKEVCDVLGVEMEMDKKINFTVGNDTDSFPPEVRTIEIGYKELLPTTNSEGNSSVWKLNRVADTGNVWTEIFDRARSTDSDAVETSVFEMFYAIDDSNSYSGRAYLSGGYKFNPPIPSSEHGKTIGLGFSMDLSAVSDGLHHVDIYGTDQNGNSGASVSGGIKHAYFVKDSQPPATTNASKIQTECDEAPYGWYNADSLGQMKIKGTGIIDSPEGASKANLRSDKVWWNFMTDGSTAPEANGSGWSEVSTVSKLLKDDLHLTLDASTTDATTGVLPMYVSFKDDLGNVSTPTAISSLKYDNDKPVIGTMVWENSSGEEILPLCNDELLNTQTLRIPFTEALSGVKKMKIWLTDGDGNEIDQNPLLNSGMKIYYKATGSSSKTLLSSSDYSVEYDDDEKVATVTFTSDSSNYAKKSGTFYITNLIATEEETTKINVEMMDCATNVSEDKTIEIHCDHVDPEVKEAKFLDTDGVEHAIKVEYYGQAAGTTRYYLAKDTLTALNATSATKIPLKLEVKESGSGIKKIKFAGDIKLSSSTKVYVGTDKTLLSTTDITISTSDQTVVFKDGKNPKLKSEGSGDTCIYFTNLVASKVNDESSNDGNALKIELTDFADNENTVWNEYSCGDDNGLSKIRIDTLSPQLAATTKVVLKDTGYTSTTRSDETKNPVDAESGYTNSNFVDMEVNYPKDEGNGSGVKKLYIKSGATIDSATKIYVKKASATEPTELVSGTDYDIVGTDCVEFAKSFFYSVNDEASTDEYTLILRDLKLSSVSNASNSTVYVYVADSVGWSSQDWTDYKDKYYASIKYLSIGIGTNAPMLGSALSCAWPCESGASGLVVDASEKNADNNTVYYFFENSNDNSSNSELGIKYSLGGNYTYAYRIYKYSGDDAFTKTAAEIVAASNTESTASGTNGYRSLADYASYSYASPATDSTAPSGTKKMWSVVFVDKGGNLSKVQSFCIVKDTQAPSEKMGDGVTAADYFPFKYESIYGSSGEEYNVMCRQDTATKYTNIYRYIRDTTNTVKISVDLSAYPELNHKVTGTGIRYYAYDDHSSSKQPAEISSSVTWGQWISVPSNGKLTIYPPTSRDSDANTDEWRSGDGMHLWLMDYCGNVARVKIMKPEHAANGGYATKTEYWERDNELKDDNYWMFADSTHQHLDGKVVLHTDDTVYYNDKAYLTCPASDDHSFFPMATTGSNNHSSDTSGGVDYTVMPKDDLDNPMYSRRVRLIWSPTKNKTFTKATVDKMTATSDSASEGCSPWYYSVAKNPYTGGDPTETMRVEYPKLSGTKYLYVAFEDGVGKYNILPMEGANYPWVYDNTPPKVSLKTDSTVSASGANAVLGPITEANKYGFLPKKSGANNRVYINGSDVYYMGGLYLGLSVSEANSSYKWKWNSNSSASPTDSDWSDSWSSSATFNPEMTKTGAVYLHFKDIVGNVTSLRFGGDVLWKNDSTNPVWKSIPSTATTNSDGTKELFNSDEGYKLTYDINTNVNIENPNSVGTLSYIVGADRDLVIKAEDLFVDNESGLKGLNEELTIDNGDKWDEGVTPNYTIAKENITTSEKAINKLQVYDNVGNWRRFVVNYKSDNSGPSYTTLTLKGTINSYGDTLYYTTQGTHKAYVTVSGIADDIGLYKYCLDHSPNTKLEDAETTYTLNASIAVYLPTSEGQVIYLHLYDRVGSATHIQLTKNGNSKWRSLDTKPDAPTGVTLKECESASTPVASINAQFTVTDAANSKGKIAYLTGQIKDTNELWIYPQTASTAEYIAGFSESADGSSLVAVGSPFKYNSLTDDGKIRLYTVDKAGNVSEKPLEITLEEELNAISCDYEILLPEDKSIGVYDDTNYFNSDIQVKLKDSVFFGEFDSWGIGTSVGGGKSSTTPEGAVSINRITGITSATKLIIWIKDKAGRSVYDWFEYEHTAGNKIGTGLTETKSTWLYDTTAPAAPTITFKEAEGTSYVDEAYGVENYCYYESSSNTFTYGMGYIKKFTVTPSSPSADTDVVGYTTDPSGADASLDDIDIKVSSNTSGFITIYAVDRAGNVSEATKVNYDCKTKWGDFDFAIDSSAVYETSDSDVNYFNSDIEVEIDWQGIGAVRYWQIGTATGSDAWGRGTAAISKSPDDTETAGSTKLKIPHFGSANTLYIWIVYTSDGGTTNYYVQKELEANGTSMWRYDATIPSVGTPSISGTTKVHGDTLYYNTTVSSNPKVSVSSISDSGVGVYGYCIDDSETAPTDLTPYTPITGSSISNVAIPASDGGKLYLHVADKLGNARTVQLIKDSCEKWRNIDEAPTAPTSVLIKEGSGDASTSTTNAKVSDDKNIEFLDGVFTSSNKLSIYPQHDGSYIAGYVEAANGTTASEYFEKYDFTDGKTYTFYAVDYAGNVSADPLTVTMKKKNAIDVGYKINVPEGTSVNTLEGTNYFNGDVTVSLDNPTFFGTFDSWGVGTAVGVGAADAVDGSVHLSAISEIGSGKSLIVWVKDTAGRTVSASLAYPASTDKLSSGSSTGVTWFLDDTAPTKPTVTVAVDTEKKYYKESSNTMSYQTDTALNITITASSSDENTAVAYYTTDATDANESARKVDGVFEIDVSENPSSDVTVYAVDKAGNISDGIKVTYKAVDFDAMALAVTGTTVLNSGVNYFKSDDIEVSLGWTGAANVTYWQLGPGSEKVESGTADYVSVAANASKPDVSAEKLKIPTSITTASTVYAYIEYSYEGTPFGTITVEVKKDDVSTWCYDATKPIKPTVTVAVDTGKYCYNGSSNKVSYQKNTTKKITITANSESSDVAYYTTDATDANASVRKSDGKFEIGVSANPGSKTIYAVDYAGNISTGIKVSYAAVDFDSMSMSVSGTPVLNNGVNYFNSDIEVSLGWNGKATVTYWQLGPGSEKVESGTADYVSAVADDTTTDVKAVKLKIPDSITTASTVYAYIEYKYDGETFDPITVEVKKNDISTWCYDATGPENLSFSDVKGNVGSTSSEDNVIVKDNTIYYRHDATKITFHVTADDDGHGTTKYAKGATGTKNENGNFTITVNGSGNSTASFYAWDGVGNVCETPLTLTFVPVKLPTVELAEHTKDGVETVHFTQKTTNSTTWYYYDPTEVEVVPTVTIDPNATAAGITYEYKAINSADSSFVKTLSDEAFDITGLDGKTMKYTVTEKDGFGRKVEQAMPEFEYKDNYGNASQQQNWMPYIAPTSIACTEEIEENKTEGAVTGHKLKYVITATINTTGIPEEKLAEAAPGVPVDDVSATSIHNLNGVNVKAGWEGSFGEGSENVYRLSSTDIGWNTTITIEYTDTSTTAAETITSIVVHTRFGDLTPTITPKSASVSAFARSRGIDLASIVADDTEISDISAVTRSPNIIRYFSAYDLNEKSEPAARFKGPDTFAIGNKVETVKDEIVKKSVTNELSVGYADREIEEPLVTGSHRWTIAQDAEDAQEVAVVSVDSGNDSVGIVEARDFQTEENGSETGKKPLNPLWFIGFAAIFSALAIILQKKRQN